MTMLVILAGLGLVARSLADTFHPPFRFRDVSGETWAIIIIITLLALLTHYIERL